jgi:hypothetical protein
MSLKRRASGAILRATVEKKHFNPEAAIGHGNTRKGTKESTTPDFAVHPPPYAM